jgi:chemotaxis signal transduction protein
MQKGMDGEVNRPKQTPDGSEAAEPLLRDLFLFTTGSCSFGVSADEVDGTSEAKRPAPLPRAPASILGVVYARGRMLTLLDPVTLLNGSSTSPKAPLPGTIVCLRGDEQLALAAESIGETITISSSDIEFIPNGSDDEPNNVVTGVLRHGGQEIMILDPSRLFNAAIQRKDRRRRRF